MTGIIRISYYSDGMLRIHIVAQYFSCFMCETFDAADNIVNLALSLNCAILIDTTLQSYDKQTLQQTINEYVCH